MRFRSIFMMFQLCLLMMLSGCMSALKYNNNEPQGEYDPLRNVPDRPPVVSSSAVKKDREELEALYNHVKKPKAQS